MASLRRLTEPIPPHPGSQVQRKTFNPNIFLRIGNQPMRHEFTHLELYELVAAQRVN
jgi:hypothetical protein